MYIAGIETSCDETGLAVYDSDSHSVYHDVYSQIEQHAHYGGVFPELASREHTHKLIPLLKSVLKKAQITLKQLDAVAYTAGPGLIGALLTGASFARSLAWALDIPAIPVNHMEGHLLAPLLESPKPAFPYIALLVSGGHTQLVHVRQIGNYEIIGDTVDDAAGEAFDKTARLLGLPYPGGAALSLLAEKGNPERFLFTRPMINRPGCDFSFSGLKTQVLTTYQNIKKQNNIISIKIKADIAASFQKTIIDTLVIKCKRALEQTNLNQLVAAGGVSANYALKQALKKLLKKRGGQVYFPRPEFSVDNGAMIAYAGFCRKDNYQHNLNIMARSRWEISES